MTFPASVMLWADPLQKYAGLGGLPGGLPFLLAWIQRESAGDPCSYTSLRESGIFQLMPPDNTNTAGTTEAELRSMCSGGSHSQTRPMTDDEIRIQVESGLRYVRAMRDRAHRKLAAAGVDWDDESNPDFWKVVKLQHAYPAPTASWLATATQALGRPPASWDEMVANAPVRQDVIDNAAWVGAFGGSSSLLGGDTGVTVLLLGGLAALAYLIANR